MIYTAMTFLQKAIPFKETTLLSNLDCVKLIKTDETTLLLYRTNGHSLFRVTLENLEGLQLPETELNISVADWQDVMKLKSFSSVTYTPVSASESKLTFTSADKTPVSITVSAYHEGYLPRASYEQAIGMPVSRRVDSQVCHAFFDPDYMKNIFTAFAWVKSKTQLPMRNQQSLSGGTGFQITGVKSGAKLYFDRGSFAGERLLIEGVLLPMNPRHEIFPDCSDEPTQEV